MRNSILKILILSTCSLFVLNSCKNNSNVWDDSNNIGSYKRAKERVLWGSGAEETLATNMTKSFSSLEDDFVPLQEDDLQKTISEVVYTQPKISPGEEFSAVPGIQGFFPPKGSLASIFRSVYFNTDEFSVKAPESVEILKAVSSYLITHNKMHIFVEGHADQRGGEAYNLSLGSRRANSIRNFLIQQGVNPEQIYTISYGKEKPVNLSNTPESWSQNRRAQFKIYEQK